jgi:hypothetical protein
MPDDQENADTEDDDESYDNASAAASFDVAFERELTACEAEQELSHSVQAATLPCSSSSFPSVDVDRKWRERWKLKFLIIV